MIIIQAILIAGFAIFLYKLLANPSSYQLRALTKIFTIIFVMLAVVVVLFPDLSNTMASWVGVTRGADLLLYLLSLSFIFAVFSLYLQEKRQQKRIAALARKIAIMEANLRESNKNKKH